MTEPSRPTSSLERRIAASGGALVAVVMLGLCAAMAWVTAQQARGHAALYAREKALAATNAVDAFDGAARQMAERYHKAFAETLRGQWTLDENSGQLSLDGDVLNDSVGKVDQFSAATGGVATVFARKGDDFVRITTSLKKQDGSRAIGTTLGAQHPAFAAMQAGQSYVGRAVLFGTPYMTRYQAVRDAAGKVVAILFIGFDVTALQGTLETMVAEGKLYETGGLAIIDPKKDLADAVFVAHGSAKGKKVAEAIPGAQATLAALQAAGSEPVPVAVPLIAPGDDRWIAVARSKLTGWWSVAEVSDGEAMRDHHRAAWGFAIAFALATLALAGGLAWMMRRQVATPLRELGTSLGSVAGGDLTHSVTARRNDEIGHLAGQAEAMRGQLAATITQVREAAQSIRVASDEVASGNADLSQRTESTASSLQQTASAMEQLTGTVRQSADSAEQANQLALTASAVASRGGEVVAQVVSTMDGISTASRRIADIIGTIDGIAFQTNILALNAAVEAARAGEQGRGFAVVAAEVRTLAQRSAEAAREIRGLIGASVEQVESGARQVREAGDTMAEIVQSVRRVTDMIGEISAATHEQSQGIGQVNQTVSTLDHMTQQNAAMVEQSAAAARSMSEQAQRLAALVQQFRT